MASGHCLHVPYTYRHDYTESCLLRERSGPVEITSPVNDDISYLFILFVISRSV